MGARKIQDEEEVKRWFEEGRTYEWMQAYYLEHYNIETTIPMWAAFRRRKGLDRRNLRDDALIPWKVNEEHRHLYPVMMLRAEARLRAGRTLSPDDARKLTNWKAFLKEDNLVVHYDEETPDGFFYVPREEKDADLIREPETKTGNQARD
ncbi:hypothetical protein K4B79_12130 [Streptomyces lincolnensis]|uniref:hypothetical protein n=1 Tax=Streptomyces lincolnensis TaxID=1915 RepID=UPI001E46B71F|nr:hypothetical protein [Streptomyces lincolnensis]MCD7438972.1 hypothetical protein [Streptomyces lincolnensis]